MEIPKIERARRNSMVKSEVKGLRGSEEFFALIDKTAKREGTSRNELIVRVMSYYCKREEEENGER